jgi:hypothetical protein
MLRPAFFLLLAFMVPGAQAQQVEPHGPGASVLSPTSDGAAHGTPASTLSPTPRIGPNQRLVFDAQRFHARFGKPPSHRRRERHEFVPVPIFIPAYPYPSDYTDADAQAAADAQSAEYAPEPNASGGADTEALREAYYRGAHDALARQKSDSRYGEHYLDSREKSATDKSSGAGESSSAAEAAAPEPADNTPATVFIFKDGHKIETHNYAIVGQTLFDFSNNQMHKIQIADLDVDATKKANDDLGIQVKLP